MAEYPFVSVLLPTYRQPEVLLLTLRDLSRQEYPRDRWELVLFDDGSRDCSAIVATASSDEAIPLTLHRAPRGGEYRHATVFNELVRHAHRDAEVFVHVEDARVLPDFLAQHAKWHAGTDSILVTGPMCEGPVETFEAQACFRYEFMQQAGAAQVYRCCFQAIFAKSMSYSARLARQLTPANETGPYDEAMSGWGYHETEFAYRAECNGALCVYDLQCAVYHPPHRDRDEVEYRRIERETARDAGTKQNVDYLCAKHSLDGLPAWKPPVAIPSAPQLRR